MNKFVPHNKTRAIFIVLVLLSMVCTLHIMVHLYQSETVVNDTVAIFQMADSVGIKEVGFVDFMVEIFRRVAVTMI